MNKKIVIGASVAGLLIFGLGSAAGASDKPEAAAPAPAPTVTVTAPAPAPVTVTKEVTPQVCLTALDKAGAGIQLLAQSPQLASEGIMAAYQRDSAALEAITSRVKALNAELDAAAPSLGEASRACRAGAK